MNPEAREKRPMNLIPPPIVADPRPRRWTKEEYYRLGELGFFRGQRVELIDGEIMVLSPQNWPHASTTDRIFRILDQLLGQGNWVRMQLPLDRGQPMEPEPDVSVVPGPVTGYTAHPTTALLIVEVSDTTLAYDRGRKASLYAAGGIPDYWIANLQDGQLEVHRDPVADPTQDFGFRYAAVTVLQRGAIVSPLAAPQLQIPVADLLP
jgi:Uma2 family endonuclease